VGNYCLWHRDKDAAVRPSSARAQASHVLNQILGTMYHLQIQDTVYAKQSKSADTFSRSS
jgi:hypothetical protein